MAPEKKAEVNAYLTCALPKGRVFYDCLELFRRIGINAPAQLNESRRLIAQDEDRNLRFLLVRATDVPTYVEYGCADFGIVGKDTLLEQKKDLLEPVDLKFGYCRLVLAAPKLSTARQKLEDRVEILRVATKYPQISEDYFAARGVQAEIIKLYGSIELAPLVELADCIVDLVSSGATLRENDMEELATVLESTCRLVVNRASLKTRQARLVPMIETLEKALNHPN